MALQVIRTLDTEGFDNFVKETIAKRKARSFEKSKQNVEMLNYFAEKLNETHLFSRKAA